MQFSGIILLCVLVAAHAFLSTSAEDFFPLLESGSSVCNVVDYGAVADGKSLDTLHIQAAVDDCGSSWKSVVYFPPGTYLTGTVFLRSNMTVFIDPEGIILGSPSQEDYPHNRLRWYVLLAEDLENVVITGGGAIDGQGLEFVLRFEERKNVMVSWNTTGACLGDECRPRLVGLVNCRNVQVSGVHLRQPAYWGLHVANSSDIHIHNLTMFGDFNTPNNDGIDIDGSNNTLITDCRLETADDGIVVKSIAGPVINLTVKDSWIMSKSCALKIGSETYHNIYGLRFENIEIVDSHRGLGIQLRDSGSIFDVEFSHIVLKTRYYDPLWWGRAEPIYVTACPRLSSTTVGSINKVRFSNILAISENGIFLAGWGGGTINSLELSNVSLILDKFTEYSGGLHDYRPGCRGLVKHRTAGVFMEHINELIMKDVSLQWKMNEMDDWDLPLDFSPRTVGNMKLTNFTSSI